MTGAPACGPSRPRPCSSPWPYVAVEVIEELESRQEPDDRERASKDVGTGRDLCLRRGVPIAIELGRHMNDRMLSLYLINPAGFAVEYGWAARTIDTTTWQIEHYTAVGSLWGYPQLRGLAP